MAIQILTDNFVGNPEQFYSLVVAELNTRALPGIRYDWVLETEFEKGLFKKGGESGQMLRVEFKNRWMFVFCFQVGTSFFVSTRTQANFDNQVGSTYLQNVILLCFEKAVDRSTRSALARYMESRSFPVPAYLAANDNEPEGQQESLQ